MKRALVILVALLATAAAVVFWKHEDWFAESPRANGQQGNPDGGHSAGNPNDKAHPTSKSGAETRESIPGQHPTATDVVRYRVLDFESRKPIASARAILMRSGTVIARTDADGFMNVPVHGLLRLAFAAKGHLSDFWAGRDAAAEKIADGFAKDGYMKILLREDAFTVPFEFEFQGPDGKPPSGLRFRVRSSTGSPPGGRSVPTAGGFVEITPAVREAWVRHYQLGLLPGNGYREHPTHFGVDSHIVDYESDGRTRLRFVATGFYEIEVRSKDGLFASQGFEVRDHQANPLVVKLGQGRFFQGRVVGAKNQTPIEGAMMLLVENNVVADMATTDDRGRFKIGPMPNRSVTLQFQHGLFQTKSVEGQRPGFDDIVVQLTPLTTRKLQGWVRQRGTRAPIFASKVELTKDGTVLATTKTRPGGMFEIDLPDNEVVIKITSSGYEEYHERIDKGRFPSRYELLPDTPERRVAADLTTLIEGTVLDSAGKPVAGVPVQLVPLKRPGITMSASGRSIYRGFAIKTKNVVVSKKDGSFQLEWPHAGPIRVRAVRGLASANTGIVVQAVPGLRRTGVRLQVGR